MHTLNDKCKSLALERKNLQFKVRRAKLDMKRMDEGLQQNQEGVEEMIEDAGATDQSRMSPQPGQEGSQRPQRSSTGRLDEEDEEGYAGDKHEGNPSGQVSGQQTAGGGSVEVGAGALASASPAVPGHFHFS